MFRFGGVTGLTAQDSQIEPADGGPFGERPDRSQRQFEAIFDVNLETGDYSKVSVRAWVKPGKWKYY